MNTSSDKNRVIIFDTTLRDGEQSPGCSMNAEEKVRIARALERLGVDVIEAGFPIASPGESAAVAAVAGGLYALRQQTLVEFAHVERQPQSTLAPAIATAGTHTSTSDQIAHLAGLHDSGAISDEEYTRAKDLVLTGPNGRPA